MSNSPQPARLVLPPEPESHRHDKPSTATANYRPPMNGHSHKPRPVLAQRLNDWWALEAAGLVVSICAASAVVVILSLYNGRPLREWRYRLSINTVVSFLGVISKSSLSLVIEGCLGQLKWIWYSRPRHRHPLLHFKTFDDASRGPYGAVQLLLKLRKVNVGLVGAFVMLCALAYEPFIQQAVSTPLLPSFLSINSSLPIATSYSTSGLGDGSDNIELPMKAAIYNGILYQNISGTATAISPTCSTGNCTFGQYSSLYVCSQCVNVTSLIDTICITSNSSFLSCTYILPNGLNATRDSAPSKTSTGALSTRDQAPLEQLLQTSTGMLSTREFDDKGPVILNFSSISVNMDNASALDCILYFCGKIYHSSVAYGLFEEITEATVHAGTVDSSSALTVIIPASLLSSGKRETFFILELSVTVLNAYLALLLQGGAYVQASDYPGPFVFSYSSDTLQALYENPDINQTITNLATSMGNYIRLKGSSSTSGTTETMETYIHVRWLWLVLPFSLEALALLTLIATAILSSSRGIPIWKCSVLAPMFHGVAIDSLEPARLESNEEMEKLAEDLQVALDTDNGRTTLKSIPDAHDSGPLLPQRNITTH
jgi:hypothetical protein